MKIDMENPKTRKWIGILLLVFALCLVGFCVKSLLPGSDEDVPTNVNQSEELSEEEREAMLNEINAKANDVKDIEPEKAKEIMGLQVEIPEEIAELYIEGNTEKLKAEMEDFLVEYDFYADVTKAVCTQIVTRDYKKEVSYLEFKLNDRAKTILTVEYRSDKDRFIFNFH